MRVIHKFPLNRAAEIPPLVGNLQMPSDAVIIHCAMQGRIITVWAQVETEVATLQDKHVLVIPTGQPMPPEYKYGEYIGTVHEPRLDDATGGEYVWHLFDVTYAYETQKKTQGP
jgi:hypothetical protein